MNYNGIGNLGFMTN